MKLCFYRNGGVFSVEISGDASILKATVLSERDIAIYGNGCDVLLLSKSYGTSISSRVSLDSVDIEIVDLVVLGEYIVRNRAVLSTIGRRLEIAGASAAAISRFYGSIARRGEKISVEDVVETAFLALNALQYAHL